MKKREEVIEQIEALATSRINDAVRLAFLTEEELGILESLDLSAVTELKRNANGTVELKFLDRLAALQWLLERAGGDPQAEKLYEALNRAAQQSGEEG